MSHSDTSKRCLKCAWITVSLREGCGELEVQTTLIPVTTVGRLFVYSHADCGAEYHSMINFCYCTVFRLKGPEFPSPLRKQKVHFHEHKSCSETNSAHIFKLYLQDEGLGRPGFDSR